MSIAFKGASKGYIPDGEPAIKPRLFAQNLDDFGEPRRRAEVLDIVGIFLHEGLELTLLLRRFRAIFPVDIGVAHCDSVTASTP